MSPNIFFNESKLVERSRSALTNVEDHPEIGPLLAEYGMDAERIAEMALYDQQQLLEVPGFFVRS